jgi:hypothetical protein
VTEAQGRAAATAAVAPAATNDVSLCRMRRPLVIDPRGERAPLATPAATREMCGGGAGFFTVSHRRCPVRGDAAPSPPGAAERCGSGGEAARDRTAGGHFSQFSPRFLT